jgi:hypothetical protein
VLALLRVVWCWLAKSPRATDWLVACLACFGQRQGRQKPLCCTQAGAYGQGRRQCLAWETVALWDGRCESGLPLAVTSPAGPVVWCCTELRAPRRDPSPLGSDGWRAGVLQ